MNDKAQEIVTEGLGEPESALELFKQIELFLKKIERSKEFLRTSYLVQDKQLRGSESDMSRSLPIIVSISTHQM